MNHLLDCVAEYAVGSRGFLVVARFADRYFVLGANRNAPPKQWCIVAGPLDDVEEAHARARVEQRSRSRAREAV